MEVTVSSPGKTILFGEHSVVFGKKALAVAIAPRVKVRISKSEISGVTVESEALGIVNTSALDFEKKQWLPLPPDTLKSIYAALDNTGSELGKQASLTNLKVTIISDLPVGSGVGSSAASAVATVAALNHWWGASLSLKKISELAFRSEEITHGTPSGIDNAISTFGGVISFEDGIIKSYSLSFPLPLIVAHSGIPRKTAIQVQKVRERREKNPEIINPVLESMHEVAEKALNSLKKNDLIQLGGLMNTNHNLLQTLGVSHPVVDALCKVALEAGALGAKLTGAGGGGCLLALAPSFDKIGPIVKALKSNNATIIASEISLEGVKVESNE